MLAAGIAVALILSVVTLVMALVARSAARARPPGDADERVAALEERVRGLVYRVWKLEGGPGARTSLESPPAPDLTPGVEAAPAPPSPGPSPVELAPPLEASAPDAPAWGAPSPAPRRGLDLEQRIGARWATWVGIVAILFGVALFLKWAFDNAFLGPAARVALGLLAGLVMLGGGLLLHRRRDVPYLSEGLAGGGLGVLYLSLFAAHALYGLVGPTPAFVAMFAVTLLGTAVAVASSRLITAVLAVLGGLLTPVLLQVDRTDERNLLAYLLVLDALVLLTARFRTWPTLNRLAWIGTALLLLPTLLHEPEAPRPLTRLLLLSALFLIFLVVPLFRDYAVPAGTARRADQIDLVLVVANAAAYFWAVYGTLEAWRPSWEGAYALGLAVLYRLVAADYASRVPDDRVTVDLHEGVSWTFLTLAIPLALNGQWVTVGWAVQGVMLLWLAARAPVRVAAWGGLAALLLAAVRAVALDAYWSADTMPVWNLAFLVHLLVVVALAVGGWLAGRARGLETPGWTPAGLRATLWVAAVGTLAVQFWREPSGYWPAVLLIAELVVVGLLARVSSSPAFVVATPLLAGVVLARVLGADDDLARGAAGSLVSLVLLIRVAACVAVGLAGGALTRSTATPRVAAVGRALSGVAGLALLFVLSVNWTRYQESRAATARSAGRNQLVAELRWRTQVGLSLLWTLYAAAALAWGFIRSNPAVRYAALGLFGLTVIKVFAVDLGAVKTGYRILSFLVLGVVLLLVSVVYQKRRRQDS
jgi:uncharacterized membrane protein